MIARIWSRVRALFVRRRREPLITSWPGWQTESPPLGIDPATGSVVLRDEWDGRPIITHGVVRGAADGVD